MSKHSGLYLCIIYIGVFMVGCSDFYRKDFVHITSATHASEQDKAYLEKGVQAMRKSQIMRDNQLQVLGIARYINYIDHSFLQEDEKKYEVFWIEIYDKTNAIRTRDLNFTLSTPYKSIQPIKIVKLKHDELGVFAPDTTYNNVYKVVFKSLGERGRDAINLKLEIKNMGKMSFYYGFAKRKSNLAQ